VENAEKGLERVSASLFLFFVYGLNLTNMEPVFFYSFGPGRIRLVPVILLLLILGKLLLTINEG